MAAPVLLVDDNAAVMDTLAEILSENGYEVITAPNGREALDWLRAGGEPPFLILLDLMMPVMDGWEFRARQRQDPALATIPVIVLTGCGDVSATVATLGVDGYLEKPFRLEQLLALLEQYAHP